MRIQVVHCHPLVTGATITPSIRRSSRRCETNGHEVVATDLYREGFSRR